MASSRMASIVAYIELREGAITSPSRFVVAEARRIADSAGATVFALLMVGPLAQVEMDQLASEISAAGADRILCSSADTLEGPALDVTHGALLAQVAEHLRPLLFLFPAGDSGVQLGPPLSVRIGAAFMANARLDVYEEDRTPEPASQSESSCPGGEQRETDSAGSMWAILERPVVASLDSGPFPPPAGEPYAEVEMVPCPDAKFPDARVVDSEIDTAADLELCRAMVWSGTPSGAASAALRAELPVGHVARDDG
jgi:electron transfer flavoprotein alpha subunit